MPAFAYKNADVIEEKPEKLQKSGCIVASYDMFNTSSNDFLKIKLIAVHYMNENLLVNTMQTKQQSKQLSMFQISLLATADCRLKVEMQIGKYNVCCCWENPIATLNGSMICSF